jgi:DNA-binding NarL/FixJ family response regulator
MLLSSVAVSKAVKRRTTWPVALGELWQDGQEIARLMELKIGTVKKRLQRMYNKLGLYNRAAAAAFFRGGPPPGGGD